MNAKTKIFLNIILISISIYFVYQLNYFNHWSGSLEDFTIVYNALIVNSGYKAEYHDHPGHSLIILVSLWLQILEFFNVINFSNFDSLNKSKNLAYDLNKIVSYSKMINVFFLLIFLTYIYKFLKIISKDKILIYLYLIIFVTSWPLLHVIDMLKPEFLSAVTIYISFYYLAELINQKKLKRKYLILSGIFFMLSIFTKFQSVFIFIFLPLYFLIFEKKIIPLNQFRYEKKIYLLFTNLIYLFFIILVYFKYVKGLNYFFIPLGIIFFLIFVNFLNNYYFRDKNFNHLFFFYFLTGAGICFLILLLIKPFHTNNINVIVNGFGQANMFIQGMSPYSSEVKTIFSLIFSAVKGYVYLIKIYFFNLSTFTLALLFILISIPIKFIKKDYKKFYVSFITFLIIATISFLFAVRPSLHYVIYLIPIVFFSTFYLMINIKLKKYLYLIITFILILNSYTVYFKLEDHKYQTTYKYACLKDKNNQTSFMRLWHKKIDQNFINRACDKNLL